jgi:hypothetical protein
MQATFKMETDSIKTFLSQTTDSIKTFLSQTTLLEIMMAVKELLHIFRSDKQVNPNDMTQILFVTNILWAPELFLQVSGTKDG